MVESFLKSNWQESFEANLGIAIRTKLIPPFAMIFKAKLEENHSGNTDKKKSLMEIHRKCIAHMGTSRVISRTYYKSLIRSIWPLSSLNSIQNGQ